MNRKALDAKKVGKELIIDIANYKKHQNCKTQICFVYDQKNRIVNPAGQENYLSKQDEVFAVIVVISPKP